LCLRSDTIIVGHINRSCYLLTPLPVTTIPVHPLSTMLYRRCLIAGQQLLQMLITARLFHRKSLAQSSCLHYAVCYATCVANMLCMDCESSSKSVPRPNRSDVTRAFSVQGARPTLSLNVIVAVERRLLLTKMH